MKTIGVVGSRRRASSADFDLLLETIFSIYESGDILVSGGCPTGADDFANTIAKGNGLSIIIHYPDWSIGKHAGFLRNTKIAESCDILIAMCAHDRTGGTEDTVKKVIALNKEIIYV